MEHDELVRAARELRPVLRERARATELARHVPDATIDLLRGAGLLPLFQPKAYGGYEAALRTAGEVTMELSAGDGAVGWVYGVLVGHAWMVSQMSRQLVEEVWGDDPTTLVGDSVVCREGSIEKVAGGYRVVGRFGFASGCHNAQWMLIGGMARNDPEAGFLALAVPPGEWHIDDNWHAVGLCGTGSGDVLVDALVPPHRAANRFVGGSEVSDAPLYRIPFLAMYPHGVLFPVLGAAQGALDDHIASQLGRVRFFGGDVADEPTTQARIAQAAADLHSARVTVLHNIDELVAVVAGGDEPSPELLARLGRDRVRAVDLAISAVDTVFRNAGGRALSLDDPLQRAWRDVHAGAAHAANAPDPSYTAYGALALGRALAFPH